MTLGSPCLKFEERPDYSHQLFGNPVEFGITLLTSPLMLFGNMPYDREK